MLAFHFDSVRSTNETSKELFADGAITEPAYVLSREQTHGKGTRGRSWCSPRDAGIYVTFVDPARRRALTNMGDLTVAAGEACVEVLRLFTGLPIYLRPINDLYVDERKLGGILTESSVQGGHVLVVHTGVGINLNRADRNVDPSHLPDEQRGSTIRPVCLEELMEPAEFASIDRIRLVEQLGEKILERQRALLPL